jgi:hypothetical protein
MSLELPPFIASADRLSLIDNKADNLRVGFAFLIAASEGPI